MSLFAAALHPCLAGAVEHGGFAFRAGPGAS